jgi:branched-chain amino acid transport system permease protein
MTTLNVTRAAGRLPFRSRPLGLALVTLLAMLPLVSGGYAMHIAVSGGLMGAAAMALTVLSGSAGLPSLGTAAFLAIGAFTAGLAATQLGLGLLPAMATSLVIGAAVGALVAVATLRVSGLYLAVGTLAVQHVVHIIATDLDLRLTWASGFMLDDPVIFGVTIADGRAWWLLVLVVLVLVYGLLRFLQRSHVGREWLLLREHPSVAGALGVSVTSSRIQIFTLTSAIIAMVGAMDGYRIGNVQAASYTVQLAIVYLTVAALGGAGNLLGALLAAYVMILLPSLIYWLMSTLGIDSMASGAGLENIVIGLVLVAALLDLPSRLRALLSGLTWRGR